MSLRMIKLCVVGLILTTIVTSISIYALMFTSFKRSLSVLQRSFQSLFISESHDLWLREQNERKNVVDEECNKMPGGQLSYEHLVASNGRNENLLQNLIVDDEHKLLFCVIPKVASTNWKRILKTLRRTVYKAPYKELIRLNDFNTAAALLRLKTYKKVIFVRHPFERLLSAFRDIFEDSEQIEIYGKLFGDQMVPHYKKGDHITFAYFVKYLITIGDPIWREPIQQTSNWARYDELCEPCLIHYDFVGYYESLTTDSEHILNQIGAPASLQFPSYAPTATTPSLIPKYFPSLTDKQISILYIVYKKDFDLFGYKLNITSF